MAADRRQRRQRNQRRTGALLGVAGALVAGLLVYQVFFSGGSGGTRSALRGPTVADSLSGGNGTTTTTAPLEPSLPNGSFDELSLRDPFEPVGQITPSVTTPTTTPTGIPTTPTTSPLQNPGPVTDVAMIDIYIDAGTGAQIARIRVGTVEYTVRQGETFATNYALVRFTTDGCADLTYASSGFHLCPGQQTVK